MEEGCDLELEKEIVPSSLSCLGGKEVCRQKKEMRELFAKANNIFYEPMECTYDGPCAGTCKLCEDETFNLLLKAKQSGNDVVYPSYKLESR